MLRAPEERELEARVSRLEQLRRDWRVGLVTSEELARQLRRITTGSVTLERAALAYARRPHLSPESASHARSFIASVARELAPLDLDAFTSNVCQQWIDRLRAEGLASSTIGTAWRMLRAIRTYAATRGWASAGPPWGDWRPRIRGRGARPREAARSPEELARLLEAARALDQEEAAASRVRLANLEGRIAAIALLGLRQGELAGLRWRDVDAAHGTVTIARQWDRRRLPKGGQVRTLAALPELFAVLAEVRARLERLGLVHGKRDDGPVFPWSAAALEGRRAHTPAGGYPRPLGEDELRRVVARAGLPRPERWTPTSLRDTFVTLEEAAHGGDLRALADRSRHASIGSLLRYMQSRSRAPAAPGFRLPPASAAAPALPLGAPPETRSTNKS